MNLLFTGASGFLGQNTLPFLNKFYFIRTVGLTEKDDYKVNLANDVPLLRERFDIVLHAAGKAHTVPKNETEEKVFFDVNVQGTKNLCAALEVSGIPRSFIYVSTVAVYGLEYGDQITEEYPLNGTSPYAISKIQAENFLIEWCSKNGVILSIVRPSLIAGPNPPGNLGAMIAGIKSGRYFSIGGGIAQKSVLMVQDIAHLLPSLCEKGGIYNVCDSEHPSFGQLEEIISAQLGKSKLLSIPYTLAKFIAIVGDFLGEKSPINSNKLEKITKSLTFSNEKARRELNWEPINVLSNFKI